MLETTLIVRLIIAAFLGSVLGYERSLSGKHAGIRTYALVSLGSCLFSGVSLIASYQFVQFVGINPLQLPGYVIIGIGFIGSGLAVFRGDHPVELTTATGIWLVAGIGLAVGFGMYSLAVAATILGVLIFTVLSKIEKRLRHRFGTGGE